MKIFIESILPKISGFSEKLDKLTLIVDEPWVIIDDKDIQTKLIFRKDNTLLISEDGNVTLGKWDLLNKAKSILLEINGSLKLYNHGFLDEGILILRIDGGNDYFVLVNQNKNPELNFENYLEKKYISSIIKPISQQNDSLSSSNRQFIKSDKGIISIEYISIPNVAQIGDNVYLNDFPAPSGKYKISTLFYIHVSNGQIVQTSVF